MKPYPILCALMFVLVLLPLHSASIYPSNETSVESPGILTLIYGDEHLDYTLQDLMNLEAFDGNGGRLKVTGDVSDIYSYTGVRISTLVSEMSNVPSAYDILTTSSDGYVYRFTYYQISGNVRVYDINGDEIGMGGVTMVLAYAENGETNFPGGPLRIVWVNSDEPVTDAYLWPKEVVEIAIYDSSDDTLPPEVSLERPGDFLYYFDKQLFRFPFTLIIGPVTVETDAYDAESGIEKVQFFIDGELKAEDTVAPYVWVWNERISGTHTIKVTSDDAAGNTASDDKQVRIFNFS
jgi:hypothetical protein